MDKIHPVNRLWRLIRSERAEIRNVYVFAIFQGLVNLSLPLGIQAIINLLQAGQLRTSWIVLVAFVLAGILFYGLLQIKQMQIIESIEQRIFAKSAFDLAYRLPRVSATAARKKYVPEMMNRFFEVSTIQRGLSKLLIDFSASAVQIMFGVILLSFYHPMFILLGVILIALLVIIFWVTGPAGLKSSMEESTQKFAVGHWLEEVSRTLMTFKLSGASSLPLEKTDNHTSLYLDARKKHFSILIGQYKVLILFKLIVAASLIIAGSFLVVNGQINIGQFVAAEIVILLVIGSVEKFILNMSTVYDLLTALEKMGNISDMPLERESGEIIFDNKTKSGISIRTNNLSFKFDDAPSNVLDKINFEVRSGEKICISGNNGAGKTTLFKLLIGYFEGYTGSIVINEVPLENIELNSYRSTVGENFNEQDIFRGSILENITCGRKNIGIEAVASIAAKLHLNNYIESLPLGYETILDPEGQKLSSGIKRKIILARCLVIQPRLLLMEDNLSVLSFSEKENIIKTIFNDFPEMTVLIISNDEDIRNKCSRVFEL